MASTSNAENLVEIATDYTNFRADFLQTRICGKGLVFANQVTYVKNGPSLSSYTLSLEVQDVGGGAKSKVREGLVDVISVHLLLLPQLPVL